ncbi:MAG: hypothetical protein ACYDHW_11275 [Syntrophorhabdaceae bacterium]
MKKSEKTSSMPGRNEFWGKAGFVVLIGLIAIFRPDILKAFFTFPLTGPLRVYHILWGLTVFILVKRMLPGFNKKISSKKIFGRYFQETDRISPKRDETYMRLKRSADIGALKSAFYWLLLLADMALWRLVGMLNDTWIYMIVLFFVFMDQFCVSVVCPFKLLARGKCCNTCRINNWGYLMAFSPLCLIPTFWTWSIVALSIIVLVQWEYIYYRHPERFFETHNAALMCRNCVAECTGKRK